eukprot:5897318-Pyramimonas_sp.AAC.1
MKADQVLKKESIHPTISDPKIYLKFENGHLVLLVSTYMGDSKATGEKMTRLKFLKTLQKHSGMDVKMNIEHSCIHTGIRHRVVDDGKCIVLDQCDYALAIKPLAATYYEKLCDDQPLSEELNACFLTLLGVVA